MTINTIIKRYNSSVDKFMFYCCTIIFLNHKLKRGWITEETWYERFVLLNALYLPTPSEKTFDTADKDMSIITCILKQEVGACPS